SSLGAGGMGEVYRARDARLGRDVAVKVLPAALAADPDRLARFEREARVVAALSHPNILAIHDFGSQGETTYAVTELLAGETLREHLEVGALPVSRTLAIAIQIANGLAAAHDKGIVHRDLKPENVMILPGFHVKILDFGLAKQAGTVGAGAAAVGGTQTQGTELGIVLGTVGYMSPEQVRGLPVDARSDIFSLGALLYEMLSGRRAFRGESQADTLSAILREEPPDLLRSARDLPLALERILRRCLEKRPDGRFRSAHDLAIALEAISTSSRMEPVPGDGETQIAPPHPRFKRLTFRNGNISSARFADEGRSVVYGAAWEGRPYEIFSSRPESPESRNLGLPPGDLHAISSTGDMALSLGYRHTFWFEASGTLARASLGGGGVRLLLEGVARADWSPDGRSLALVRSVGGRYRVEYPPGTTLCETDGWVRFVRVSRDGTRVAFSDHPESGDGAGGIGIVDRTGRRIVLTGHMVSVTGLCWSPDGSEVWYSGITEELESGIWAASPSGGARALYLSPTRIRLHDVAPGPRLLVSTENLRLGAIVGEIESPGETDLSWFDASLAADLSRDGSQLLFTEVADAENPHYAVYLRGTNGSAAVRLGDGIAMGFSPDGAWALAIHRPTGKGLGIYPTGIGESRSIRSPEVERYRWARWHPDGESVLFVGSAEGGARRLYRQSLAGGRPRLLLDEEIGLDWATGVPISPDGTRLVIRRADGTTAMLHADTSTCEPISGIEPGEAAARFDSSGRHLFLARTGVGPPRIEKLDLATGERGLWRELRPPEPSGIIYIGGVVVAPEGGRYAYSYLRSTSDLYLLEGIG
ncbi:MAG TPA: protein kinase, partial [Candidatus Eisenbacteria bacterium]